MIGVLIAELLREAGWSRDGSCGFAGHVDCLMRRPDDDVDRGHVHGMGCTADICGPVNVVCAGVCRTTGEPCVGHPLPTRLDLVARSIAGRLGNGESE